MKNQNDFRMCNNANARPRVDMSEHQARRGLKVGSTFFSVKSAWGSHYNLCVVVCMSHAGVTCVRARACAADEVERAPRAARPRRGARGLGVPRRLDRGVELPRPGSTAAFNRKVKQVLS